MAHRAARARHRRRRRAAILTLGAALLIGFSFAPAAAEGSGPPRGVDFPYELGGQVFGQLGFGRIGEDFFLSIVPGVELRFWRLAMAIHAPLRFRVIDRTPKQSGVLRSEDWDELSDYTRILRFVVYGRPDSPLYVRLGELAGASLGHGTIVHHYFNTANINHYKTGLEARLDYPFGGGEILIDNIVDPNVLAARGFARPLRSLGRLLEELVLGVTYASDYRAPTTIRTDHHGFPVVTPERRLAAGTAVTTLFGFDLSWRVVRRDWIEMTPYFDTNFLDLTGQGVHAGLFTRLFLADEVGLLLRVEYRYLTERYSAGYFNSAYEIERYQYRRGQPKRRQIRDRQKGPGRHGFLGEVTVVFPGEGSLTVLSEGHQSGGDNRLMVRLRLPWLGPVMAQLYYSKHNFAGAKELAEMDDTLLMAEARFRVWRSFFVFARYARQWHLVERRSGARYETLDDWDVGVGAALAF